MTTIMITGATDGLGRALAHALAADGADGADLILHGRDPDRLDATARELREAYGRPHRTALADLASLAQVRDLAQQVRDATDRLDVLVSNAGIGGGEPDGRERRVSADGHELRFAVNYLAGFLLTQELLPLLRPAAGPARIVNVASIGQHPIDFDDLMIEHGYSGMRAYGQSKLAQIMSGFTLAERLDPAEVIVNSLHPATYMPTKMVMAEIGYQIDSVADGVEATRRLVSDPGVTVTGRFFDRLRETRANAQAYDEKAREQLWTASLDLVGRR